LRLWVIFNLCQILIALNVLAGRCRSGHLSFFRCFDRFPSNSRRRFSGMAFLSA
jgi:hypothetical protein